MSAHERQLNVKKDFITRQWDTVSFYIKEIYFARVFFNINKMFQFTLIMQAKRKASVMEDILDLCEKFLALNVPTVEVWDSCTWSEYCNLVRKFSSLCSF